MNKGIVIGEVWATKKSPSLQGRSFKLVAISNSDGQMKSNRVVVAIDTLDASIGNNVMVSYGSGARNVIKPGSLENFDILCDCAISQIIDQEELY